MNGDPLGYIDPDGLAKARYYPTFPGFPNYNHEAAKGLCRVFGGVMCKNPPSDDGDCAWGSSGNNKGKKGKAFRGGKKKERDKWYGIKDKGMQKWWEKEGKKELGFGDINDASKGKEAWGYWNDIGSPSGY